MPVLGFVGSFSYTREMGCVVCMNPPSGPPSPPRWLARKVKGERAVCAVGLGWRAVSIVAYAHIYTVIYYDITIKCIVGLII